jgi:general secretion pathway protein G
MTMTELVLVLAILSILTAVAVPTIEKSVKRQREIELRRALRILRSAIDDYKRAADMGWFATDFEQYGYPPDLETLVEGVEKQGLEGGEEIKFLRKIPLDPMTNSYDWGMKSYQDEADAESWGGENVFDVYTTSQAAALDGTSYNDW